MSNIRRVIETIFMVYDKNGDLVPFIFNNIQLEIDREVIEPIERFRKAYSRDKELPSEFQEQLQTQLRHSILKYRQGGVTTLIMAWFLVDCMARYSVSVMLTHDKEHSERLLYRARLMLKNLKGPKPKFSKLNENEIAFEKTQSVFYIGTAGSKEFGRSATINNLHCSEISFWKDPASLMKSLFQAIPKATGVIIQETTANGWGNWFQKSYYNYLSGRGGFSARFYPWYIHEEYFSDTPFQSELFTMDERKLEWSLAKVIYKALPGISKHEVRRKLQWRREKIDEAQGDRDRSAAYRDFQQEYPITYREAFIMTGGNLFGVVEVEASALWSYVGPGAYHLAHDLSRFFSYSLGADFAGGTGHDFSSIVVLCLELRCQVYAYRNNQINPVAFAEKICEVGRTYNALLVPEVNNHGLAGVAIIKRNYELAKIYKHILPQGFTNASMNIPSHGYGWKTTGQTKPYMVGIASQFLLSGWKVYCPILSDELMSFVEDPQTGKLEGAGDHDDSAIAFMLACLGILRLLKFAGTNLLDLETIPELPASVTEEPKSVTATLVSSPSWRDSNGTYQVAFTDMFKLKGRRSSHA
jgi:hypothetical protein